MAKTYENFKKEFATLDTKLKAAMAKDLTYRTNYQKQRLTMLEGAAVIGLRVQELKAQGQKGNSVDDFKNDREVGDMLDTAEGFAKQLDKLHAPLKAERDGLVASLNKLETDLEAEIKTRQKAVSTKQGTGNKSLPDMVELLKDIKDRRKEKPVHEYLTGKILAPTKWRTDVDRYIKDEVGKTREVALSDFQQTMRLELLGLKNLTIKVGQATRMYRDLQAVQGRARSAVTGKDGKALRKEQDAAEELREQLDDMAGEYEKAMKDSWISNQVEVSKDKSKIMKGLSTIAEAQKRGTELARSITSMTLQ